MTWGWVNYQQKFFLKVNYSFKIVAEALTRDSQHLQADEGFERRGTQGPQVVPAQIQKSQRGQTHQSLISQHLHRILLQMQLLQPLEKTIINIDESIIMIIICTIIKHFVKQPRVMQCHLFSVQVPPSNRPYSEQRHGMYKSEVSMDRLAVFSMACCVNLLDNF